MPRALERPPRELGSHYTPKAVARSMVRACLDRWLGEASASPGGVNSPGCRVLDPACGDGAFLLEVFDELCRRYAIESAACAPGSDCECNESTVQRLDIVRRHIFGVDIDLPAIEALRSHLRARIAASGELAGTAAQIVEANIRCGNSLAGPDGTRPAAPKQPDLSARAGAIDWRCEFPAAANAGGFDVIIGNPPYLRERNARALFDSLAATDLGRLWREARMDLWYYFVHRSLDLLRPGGILAFIVNSYWMSSRGARKLIDRLERETRMEEIVLLENSPVFNAVAGRHMIFRLQKRGDRRGRSQSDSDAAGACRIIVPRPSAPRQRKRSAATAAGAQMPEQYDVPLSDIYQQGRLVVARPDPKQDIFRGRARLAESFDTRQGIAENPPRINRRLHREAPHRYAPGEGVFVLQADEIERLHLSPAEHRLLRPYYELSATGRYQLAEGPTHQVLYLTGRTALALGEIPNLARHLERFRPILERRRETREGKTAWWHLHWPRAEEIFLRPRILSVQMGDRPQFVFVERPAFVGFSINIILAKRAAAPGLDALTGILNSDVAASWFDRHAKRRGVNLEINAHVLRQFPLPGRDEDLESKIAELVRERQRLRVDEPPAPAIEREIEDRVAQLYNATM
jgi:adenine-specific DNA-methyltransferase